MLAQLLLKNTAIVAIISRRGYYDCCYCCCHCIWHRTMCTWPLQRHDFYVRS